MFSMVGVVVVLVLVGGVFNGVFGCCVVIFLVSVFFIVGFVVLVVVSNKEMLFVGCLVVGFGIGIVFMIVLVYIVEVLLFNLRG